jgi:hypothetical protein
VKKDLFLGGSIVTRVLIGSLSFACVLLVAACSAQAVSIQYQQGSLPDASYSHVGAELWGGNVNANSGAGTMIRVGRAAQPAGAEPIRGVLGFDLAGVPAGHVITSATLTMTIYTTGDGTPGAVDLFEITAATPLAEGTGTITETGDGVTWNTVNGTTAWATPGGDFSPTVLSSIPASAGGSGALGDKHVYASSPAFVAAANAALSSNEPLNLILAMQGEGAEPRAFWRYVSDDIMPDEDFSIEFRPLLTIETAEGVVPEPSVAILAAAALISLVFHRAQKQNR